jgi:hypothetical protein
MEEITVNHGNEQFMIWRIGSLSDILGLSVVNGAALSKTESAYANHADCAPGGTLMVAPVVQGIDLRRSLGKRVAASRFARKNDFP